MIDYLDHLVLTTSRREACVDFFTRVLGMQLKSFVGGTPPVEGQAFKFGNQKITSMTSSGKCIRLITRRRVELGYWI